MLILFSYGPDPENIRILLFLIRIQESVLSLKIIIIIFWLISIFCFLGRIFGSFRNDWSSGKRQLLASLTECFEIFLCQRFYQQSLFSLFPTINASFTTHMNKYTASLQFSICAVFGQKNYICVSLILFIFCFFLFSGFIYELVCNIDYLNFMSSITF